MASAPTTRRERPLGATQKYVLVVLLGREAAATDWSAWYPLTEGQVRGAINALSMRGLVDVAGWTGSRRGREARTFKLTSEGVDLARQLIADDEDDEDAS